MTYGIESNTQKDTHTHTETDKAMAIDEIADLPKNASYDIKDFGIFYRMAPL